MLLAQSTTKDYIRAEAERKLQSISKLFILQVIIPQVFFFFLKPHLKIYPQFLSVEPEKQTHVLEPIYILRALKEGKNMDVYSHVSTMM